MYITKIKKCVKLFDKAKPNWKDCVDEKRFFIVCKENCVAGQAFADEAAEHGEYSWGYDYVKHEVIPNGHFPEDYGLVLDILDGEAWNTLEEEWKQVLWPEK
jgi:hypothetical protein